MNMTRPKPLSLLVIALAGLATAAGAVGYALITNAHESKKQTGLPATLERRGMEAHNPTASNPVTPSPSGNASLEGAQVASGAVLTATKEPSQAPSMSQPMPSATPTPSAKPAVNPAQVVSGSPRAPTLQEINDLWASIGPPGEKRDEKMAACLAKWGNVKSPSAPKTSVCYIWTDLSAY
jgi:hypothetical protein